MMIQGGLAYAFEKNMGSDICSDACSVFHICTAGCICDSKGPDKGR